MATCAVRAVGCTACVSRRAIVSNSLMVAAPGAQEKVEVRHCKAWLQRFDVHHKKHLAKCSLPLNDAKSGLSNDKTQTLKSSTVNPIKLETGLRPNSA